MRVEKQILTKEYIGRLNGSPFFIVVGYQGLKVDQLTTLRKSLNKTSAEVHVVKNSIFRIAAKEAGVADLNGALAGQIAVVTGQKDVSAAAKALKTFAADNDKLKIKFGYLNNVRMEAGRHHDARGFAEHRSVAQQDLGRHQRSGAKAGHVDQYTGLATGPRHQGEVRAGRLRPKPFPAG
jgi:large subunit ribosomal protein L10